MPRPEKPTPAANPRSPQELVIFGTGAFAEIAHYYFSHDSERRVVAFCVDGEFLDVERFQGLPVVPAEELKARYPAEHYSLFVAVGHGEGNQARARKVEQFSGSGYELASFVSTRAHVAPDLHIGPNSMVMEEAVLQPWVEIGRDSMIWSTTRIGLRSRIGDHCWLVCPLLGESVRISDYTFVGLNATIGPHVTVAARNVIGAGALILRDTKEAEIYPGDPTVPTRAKSDRLRQI